MCDPTAPSGGGIRHHRNSRTLEYICQLIFGYVTTKFNAVISSALLANRIDVAGRLGMISAPDHESRFRHFLHKQIECLDHQFQALVGSPFAECKDAVNWIATP
jgi:hypothetical protein